MSLPAYPPENMASFPHRAVAALPIAHLQLAYRVLMRTTTSTSQICAIPLYVRYKSHRMSPAMDTKGCSIAPPTVRRQVRRSMRPTRVASGG
jgi:hypothetical protein